MFYNYLYIIIIIIIILLYLIQLLQGTSSPPPYQHLSGLVGCMQ